jgi:hypothetical protein
MELVIIQVCAVRSNRNLKLVDNLTVNRWITGRCWSANSILHEHLLPSSTLNIKRLNKDRMESSKTVEQTFHQPWEKDCYRLKFKYLFASLTKC